MAHDRPSGGGPDDPNGSRLDSERALTLLQNWNRRREATQVARDGLYHDGGNSIVTLDDEDVFSAIANRLSFGWAVEVERLIPAGGSRPAEATKPEPVPEAIPLEEKPTDLPPRKTKDHFIIVELVGENGEPIPGELCRITLPDGEVVERQTDSQGRVEEYQIIEGECQIQFPNLDKEAWEAAA